MACFSHLQSKLAELFLTPEMFPLPVFLNMLHFPSQAFVLAFFFFFGALQSPGKGMEAEVGHAGPCHLRPWVQAPAAPVLASGSGMCLLT